MRTCEFKARIAVLNRDHTWVESTIEGTVEAQVGAEGVTQGEVGEAAEDAWNLAHRLSPRPEILGVYVIGYEVADEFEEEDEADNPEGDPDFYSDGDDDDDTDFGEPDTDDEITVSHDEEDDDDD